MGTSSKSGKIALSGREGMGKGVSKEMKPDLKPGNKEKVVEGKLSKGGKGPGMIGMDKKDLGVMKTKGVKLDDHKKEINMHDQPVYHKADESSDDY